MEKILKRMLRGWLRRRVVKIHHTEDIASIYDLIKSFQWIYAEHVWAWPSCLYCLKYGALSARSFYRFLKQTDAEDADYIRETDAKSAALRRELLEQRQNRTDHSKE